MTFLRLTLFSFDLSCDQLLTEQRFDFLPRIVFTLFTPLFSVIAEKEAADGLRSSITEEGSNCPTETARNDSQSQNDQAVTRRSLRRSNLSRQDHQ